MHNPDAMIALDGDRSEECERKRTLKQDMPYTTHPLIAREQYGKGKRKKEKTACKCHAIMTSVVYNNERPNRTNSCK